MSLFVIPFVSVLLINACLSVAFFKVKKVSIFISTILFLLLLGNFSYTVLSEIQIMNSIEINKGGSLNYLYHAAIGLLLLEIFYDFILLKKDSFNTDVAIKSIISFALPCIIGFLFAMFFNKDLKVSLLIGLIFSVTAIPILAKFLHNAKISQKNKTEIMSIAIITDIFAWLISLLFNDIEISKIFYLLLSFLVFYLLSKKVNIYIVLIIYFVQFVFLNISHLFAIILPLILVINRKQEIAEMLGLIKKYKILDFVLIPFIIFYVTYNIDIMSQFKKVNNLTYGLCLILLPIIIKIFSGFFAFRKNSDRVYISILLNTRGLTEIVFLNMFMSMYLISFEEYICFIIMTFLSTLLPTIFPLICSKHNKNNCF